MSASTTSAGPSFAGAMVHLYTPDIEAASSFCRDQLRRPDGNRVEIVTERS
jgi:hypothetical protein